MAKKTGNGVLSSPMGRAPWQKISLHGNVTTGTNVANGPTNAAMIPVKAKPVGVSSPMAPPPKKK